MSLLGALAPEVFCAGYRAHEVEVESRSLGVPRQRGTGLWWSPVVALCDYPTAWDMYSGRPGHVPAALWCARAWVRGAGGFVAASPEAQRRLLAAEGEYDPWYRRVVVAAPSHSASSLQEAVVPVVLSLRPPELPEVSVWLDLCRRMGFEHGRVVAMRDRILAERNSAGVYWREERWEVVPAQALQRLQENRVEDASLRASVVAVLERVARWRALRGVSRWPASLVGEDDPGWGSAEARTEHALSQQISALVSRVTVAWLQLWRRRGAEHWLELGTVDVAQSVIGGVGDLLDASNRAGRYCG